MGYIKHNAIVVTGLDIEQVNAAYKKAKDIFGSLVSNLIPYAINSGASFLIGADGSKEGWNDSNEYDQNRKDYCDWFLANGNYSDYIEVRFGGDDNMETIERSKDKDLNTLEDSH